MLRSCAALLAAAAFAAPSAAAIATRTVIAAPTARAGWFLCDSVDSPWAALVGKVAGGAADITLVAKPSGAASTMRYTVGDADPGAGQIYYGLGHSGGGDAGNLHAVNPGLLDPSLPEPLNFTSISIDGRQLSCRLINDLRLSVLTARRGVTVTREAGKLAYRSYDFAHPGAVIRPDGVRQTNAPSLLIPAGTESRTANGSASFRFVNGNYVYRIALPAGTAAGTLTVRKGGRLILSERLLGFTLVTG